VRTLELVIAVVLTALGVRSMIVWARRPFASTALTDQLLYAAYRTGRVGIWFAFAGLFWIFAFAPGASSDGQRYTQDISRYSWFVVLFAVLAVLQLIGGWFLGHRTSWEDTEAERDAVKSGEARPEPTPDEGGLSRRP